MVYYMGRTRTIFREALVEETRSWWLGIISTVVRYDIFTGKLGLVGDGKGDWLSGILQHELVETGNGEILVVGTARGRGIRRDRLRV